MGAETGGQRNFGHHTAPAKTIADGAGSRIAATWSYLWDEDDFRATRLSRRRERRPNT